MKKFVISVCIIFAHLSLSAQHLYDTGLEHTIRDAIRIDSTDIIYSIYGTCRFGSIETDKPERLITYPFVVQGGLSYLGDRWIALTTYRISDDLYPNMLEMAYLDAEGNEVRHEIKDLSVYIDFTMFKEDRIAIYGIDKELLIYDLNGNELHRNELDKDYFHLESIDGSLYGLGKGFIDRIDETGTVIESLTFEDEIKAHDLSGNLIYLAFGSTIKVYNKSLEMIRTIELSSQDILDLYDHQGDLHVLSSRNESVQVSKLKENGAEEELYSTEIGHVYYSNFIKGSTSDHIYGQHMPDADDHAYVTHGVVNDITSEPIAKRDLSLSLLDIEEVQDTIGTYETPTGVFHDISYSYPLSFSLTNMSDRNIDSVKIVSNRKSGVNCSVAQRSMEFKNLNLAPGASIEIDTTLRLYRRFEEICFFVISVNGALDLDVENNTTCRNPVNTSKVSYNPSVVVYPNPSQSYLTISTEDPIARISIFNHLGQLVKYVRHADRQIDIHDLEPGIYYLETENTSRTHRSRATFIKQ